MSTGRLEVFSDGVLAIIITITELTMSAPQGDSWQDLIALIPKFLSYIMSFTYVGIYWNNHHHLMSATERVTAGVLWANLIWLFWLLMIPLTTDWIGKHSFASVPGFAYRVVLLMVAISYWALSYQVRKPSGTESVIVKALGKDIKARASVVGYLIALALTFVAPTATFVLYALVALAWFIPDRRIELALNQGA